MYVIDSGKSGVFKCNIQLEGVLNTNTSCRIIIESENYALMFPGKIEGNECEITYPVLKSVINEQSEFDKIKLEVIAEDTYFCAWESNLTLKQPKTAVVNTESITSPTKLKDTPRVSKVSVIVEEQPVVSEQEIIPEKEQPTGFAEALAKFSPKK